MSARGAVDADPAAVRAALRARVAPLKAAFVADARLVAALPDVRARQRAAAERAFAGEHVLPGTGGAPRALGSPPDWLTDPVGDAEFVWVLNRMGHWRALLGEGLITGDPRWSARVVAELADWLTRCPPPDVDAPAEAVMRAVGGVHPWRLLEVGIRLFDAWRTALALLADDPALDDATFARWTRSIAAHADAIVVATPRFWPGFAHNHALMEGLGALTAGCLLAELPRAAAWRDAARRILEGSAAAQLTAEGGQIEGCPHYHHGCVAWFVQALITGREHGVAWSDAFATRVLGMGAYALHATRPTGETVPWGDSDADRGGVPAALWVWLASRDDAALAHAVGLAGVAAALADSDALLWRVAGVAELRDAVVRAGAIAARPAPTALWARGLDQAMLRSGWERDAASVLFACRAPVNNGHAHVDPMGFDFTALGAELVADPGRFTYRDDADRAFFKSAEAHATVTVDGRPPFAAVGTYDFTPQPRGAVRGLERRDGQAWTWARLDWLGGGRHERLLALIDGRWLVVVDRLGGFGAARRARAWLPLAAANARWDERRRIAVTDGARPGIAIAASAGDGAIEPGRTSKRLDVATESVRVRLDLPLADGGGAWALALAPFADRAPDLAIACSADPGGVTIDVVIGGVRRRIRWDGDAAVAITAG